MLWQKIKDNKFDNKKLNNVVITGGGSQLDNIEKYVETIFASSTRVANPLDKLNLKKIIISQIFAMLLAQFYMIQIYIN